MSTSDTVRRALRERVARKVAGSGISSRAIDRAVDAVVSALPPEAAAPPSGGDQEIIVALTARSVPDLGSRVRAGIAREGAAVSGVAVATAGQHTVVTLRAPATARDAIARVAAAQKASFTVVEGDGSTATGVSP